MIPEKCRDPNSNPDSPENPTIDPGNPTKVPENPTIIPTKKPEINLTTSNFTVDENKNANLDFSGNDYSDEFEYNIEIKSEINSVTVNTNDKDVSLIIPDDKKEMTFSDPENGPEQKFTIIPKADEVTITLSTKTLASIEAGKKVTLKSENNEKLSLKQVSPKSQNFILASNVSIDIEEAVFSGNQGMDIQLTEEGTLINITNITVQQSSSGTINNAVITNIVLAPLSSLNIASNVDLSETSIDFPFNNDIENQEQAPLSGELGKSPRKIEINEREIQYLENKQKILIAESSSANFECNEWSKTFNKGPFNTKFTSSECKNEEKWCSNTKIICNI